MNRKENKNKTAVTNEVFGTLINLAGRQRMLSQRIILNAFLALKGDQAALAAAREALALFKDTHSILVHGKGEMPGLFFDQLRLAYFGPDQADRKIQEFMQLAERALEENQAHGLPSLLAELGQLATPIVGILNAITLVYEAEFKRQVLNQKKQQQAMMSNIKDIAKQARIVSVNAQIIAARAGHAGREFSVVASVLSNITSEMDDLVRVAMSEA